MDPLPAVPWALARPLRLRGGRWLTGGHPLRAAWERLTTVPVVALVYAAVLWAWHLPRAYEAALGGEWGHHATVVPRVTTLTPLEDQALGGVIMWAGSSTVDMLAVLALVWRLLAALERPVRRAAAELGAK